MQHLSIFIGHERLIQTFLNGRIESELSRNFKTTIYLSPTINLTLEDSVSLQTKSKVIKLSENIISSKLQILYLDCATFAERDRSISFESRIRKIYSIPRVNPLNINSLWKAGGMRGLLIGLAGVPKLGKMFVKLVNHLSLISSSVGTQIELLNRSERILILTGGAFGGIENVILNWANKKMLKSVMIVDNWDNLSSKSMYSRSPSLVGVWGASMEQDAIHIQGFKAESVRIIGSSRVDLAQNAQQSARKPYMLFCGSGWKFSDELKLVTDLSEKIFEHYPNLEIVYRPHPAYLDESTLEKYRVIMTPYKNLNLDSNLFENYGVRNLYEQESLIHTEQIIKNANLVLAAHSTMIVEALYYGVRTICYSGSQDLYLARENAWESYHHMNQLRGTPGLIETTTSEDFINQVLTELNHDNNEIIKVNFAEHVIPSFTNSYSERVMSLLSEVEGE